jgi:YVTN family beta-propeller protein
VQFGVLGPLEVRDGERRIPVGGPRQRALLAALLLQANEVVSRDRLMEALWGERPPDSAENALHRVVSQLRKQLDAGDGAPSPLVTRPPGYAIEIDPEALDLTRFEGLLAAGRRALERDDPREAAERLREGLALWRGPALADLADPPFARGEIGRLEEERCQALEERVEADLRIGRARELVPELEALVAVEPYRERLRQQLMLALYRSGRQADALAAYREGRRRLVEELGIEPGPQLQQLERDILRQDPSLDAPTPEAPRDGPRRPRGRWIVIGLSAVVLAAVATVVAVRAGSGGGAITEVPANSVAIIDPGTNRVVGDVPVGSRPIAVAVGEGSVWAVNADDRTLSRIDPETREVVRTIGLGTPAVDVAAGAGSVWVADGSEGTLSRVDPRSNAVAETIRVGEREALVSPVAQAVTVGWGSVWLTSGADRVLRIDPATGAVRARIAVPVEPVSLAAAGDALWVGSLGRRVARIDAGANAVTARIPVHQSVSAVAAGEGAVWAAVCCATVWRIDPLRSLVEQTISVGSTPSSVAVGEGAVWVTSYDDGTVTRIDPRTNQAVATIRVGHRPLDVAVGDGAVWVAVQSGEVT